MEIIVLIRAVFNDCLSYFVYVWPIILSLIHMLKIISCNSEVFLFAFNHVKSDFSSAHWKLFFYIVKPKRNANVALVFADFLCREVINKVDLCQKLFLGDATWDLDLKSEHPWFSKEPMAFRFHDFGILIL